MRLRCRFSKQGKVRFTSHRDVARIWERAIRKAGLPVAYTEGYSPRPKLHFGLALSTGYESLAEYIDIDLRDDVEPDEPLEALPVHLSEVLPEGMDVTAIAVVDRRSPSLQQSVTSCRWEIDVLDDTATVQRWSETVLDAPTIVVTRERKGKAVTDDLRPGILDLEILESTPTGVRISAELGTQPRAIRPAELLGAVSPHLEASAVRRTHQWIRKDDGARHEPLLAGAAVTATTLEVVAS